MVKLEKVNMERQVAMLEEDLANFQERGSTLEEVMASMHQMEEEKTWHFQGTSLSRLEQTTSMEEYNFVSDFNLLYVKRPCSDQVTDE